MVKISPFVVFKSVVDREFPAKTTAPDTVLASLEMVAPSNRCSMNLYLCIKDLQIFFTPVSKPSAILLIKPLYWIDRINLDWLKRYQYMLT